MKLRSVPADSIEIAINNEKRLSLKVFFLKDDVFNGETNIKIIPLRHPQTKSKSHYIVQPKCEQKLFEVLQFNEAHRSWFVEDQLSPNGRIYITTPVDPLFMFLHYAQEKCIERYMTLDQILEDEEYPEISQLNDLIPKEQLLLVSDYKQGGNLHAYKFNETKTLHWLNFKVRKLAKKIIDQAIHIDSATQCASFVKSEKLKDVKLNDDVLRYSMGILNEYISVKLSKTLEKYLGLEEIQVPKRKSTEQVDQLVQPKRSRIDQVAITTKAKSSEPKVSTKEKARAKAASGAKSITSFFKSK